MQSLMTYCRKALGTVEVLSGECGHYQRHFYNVKKIDHSYECDYKTVMGTQRYFAWQKTAIRGVICVQNASYFYRFGQFENFAFHNLVL